MTSDNTFASHAFHVRNHQEHPGRDRCRMRPLDASDPLFLRGGLPEERLKFCYQTAGRWIGISPTRAWWDSREGFAFLGLETSR